jgi:hypothetical protein
VKSEETENCNFGIPPFHACYGVKAKSVDANPGELAEWAFTYLSNFLFEHQCEHFGPADDSCFSLLNDLEAAPYNLLLSSRADQTAHSGQYNRYKQEYAREGIRTLGPLQERVLSPPPLAKLGYPRTPTYLY